MRQRILLLISLCTSSCAWPQATQPADYGAAEPLGVVADARVRELSGLAASRRHPGCFYTCNDSTPRAEVLVLDRRARTRATLVLRGTTAVDWEALSLAPGATPEAWELCVADIGDNAARRDSVIIYRFAEPNLPEVEGAEVTVEPRSYRLRYPDGPADAEAFCVHPQTGTGYVLTKRGDGKAAFYRLAAPWPKDGLIELERVARLDLPPAALLARLGTAADISPDGRRLAVRCYLDGWEWRLEAARPLTEFESLLGGQPRRLELPIEPQGEALAYTLEGHLVTVSEWRNPVLWEIRVTPR